jgi:uncharacterized spore protein YtfJ
MEHVKELMGLVLGQVENVAKSDIVVGDAITLGDVTIVPLSRMTIGFGAGGGEGEGEGPHDHKRSRRQRMRGKGVGGASGMGAKVRPIGVVVFSADGVEVHPITAKRGLIDKVFDRIPEVIDLAKDAASGSKHVAAG